MQFYLADFHPVWVRPSLTSEVTAITFQIMLVMMVKITMKSASKLTSIITNRNRHDGQDNKQSYKLHAFLVGSQQLYQFG